MGYGRGVPSSVKKILHESPKGTAMTQTTPAEQQSAHQHSYIANNTKDDYLKRLRRIEGQARGLQRMVEEEQYCIDILTQVSAMTKALRSVALGLLDEHMAHCVVDAAREGDHEAEIKLKEASDAIARLVRS
jgi:CsoR family transcriptional regulator, copper-sensing transcriptional repressor